MSLELPFGVKPVNPVAVDYWSGPYSGVLTQEAVDAANSGIQPGIRYVGQEATLVVSGVSQKYWYESGVTNSDLVPFPAGSGGGGDVSLVDSNPSGVVWVNNSGQITTDEYFLYDSDSDRIHLGSGGVRFSDGSIQLTAVIDEGSYFTGPAYAVWTGSNLNFNVIYPNYFLDGQQFAGGNDLISLPSGDSTYDRFDAIIVDSSGASSIQGVPEVNHVFPSFDSVNELLVTYIEVPTSGTVPGNVNQKQIYDENVEWTGSGNLTNLNFDDLTDPQVGTKHISFDGFSNTGYIQFEDAGAATLVSSFSVLRFYIKLGAAIPNNRYLRLRFYRSGSPISDYIDITNGNYNYDRSNTNWQLIIVPLSEFSFTSAELDSLYIGFNQSAGSTIYLDNIALLTDAGTQPQPDFFRYVITDNGIVFANQPNDALRLINTNKTGDKEITITVGGSGNRAYVNTTVNHSMNSSDDVVFADSSSNPINVYIPTAGNVGGKELMIKRKTGNDPVTIVASGAETIDGQSSHALYSAYESITLISDNSNWLIS